MTGYLLDHKKAEVRVSFRARAEHMLLVHEALIYALRSVEHHELRKRWYPQVYRAMQRLGAEIVASGYMEDEHRKAREILAPAPAPKEGFN